MALDQQMGAQAPAQEDQRLTEQEEQDLSIAVMLAEKLIDDGGIDVIQEAVKSSKDPGQVVGQFLMQMVSTLGEKMPEEMQLSKRIYFAEGGWIEQVSDFLQEEYGIERNVMDRAEMYIGTAAQKMAQGGAQQGAQGAAPSQQGAAPMPTQAPMPAGGV